MLFNGFQAFLDQPTQITGHQEFWDQHLLSAALLGGFSVMGESSIFVSSRIGGTGMEAREWRRG